MGARCAEIGEGSCKLCDCRGQEVRYLWDWNGSRCNVERWKGRVMDLRLEDVVAGGWAVEDHRSFRW